MKKDLDALMNERKMDALVVTGNVLGNPPLKYMVGEAGVMTAVIVKKKGEPTILIHGVMEREEARASGLELMDFEEFGMMEIARQGKGPFSTAKEFLKRIFTGLGISGRVGFYGRVETSYSYPLLVDLARELDGVEWVREEERDIFTQARLTKDREEIAHIRSAGEGTGRVIEDVIDLLRSAEKVNGSLINSENGQPLTIGDVKRFITRALGGQGLLEEEATIFSLGYDTAVPHNRGKVEEVVRAGEPIVFDIFPADALTGYHYDVTRSMVVGDPPEQFLKLYEEVKGACEVAEGLLREGNSASEVNTAVVDYFEEKGHPTLRTEGNQTDGYIHSLGHGIGLNVHESPSLGLVKGPGDRFEKGMVFTVEPGLYYPDRSIGVRIEDVYWMNEDGVGEKVVDIPYIFNVT